MKRQKNSLQQKLLKNAHYLHECSSTILKKKLWMVKLMSRKKEIQYFYAISVKFYSFVVISFGFFFR